MRHYIRNFSFIDLGGAMKDQLLSMQQHLVVTLNFSANCWKQEVIYDITIQGDAQ